MNTLLLTLVLFSFLAEPVIATKRFELQANQAFSAISASHGNTVPVPEPSDKAMKYYRSGNILWIMTTIWGLLIPFLFLFTGFSARIRNLARRVGKKWFFVVGTYFAVFSLINYLLDLPLVYYQGFVREHEYGLSNQTFEKWFTDSLKELMVFIILGFFFVWIPYLLLKKSPRRWWLYTAILSVPFLLFIFLISPIWIDPLFNKFGPMKNKQLEAKILGLAQRAGIEGGRVFEVDKGVDTKKVNAYVTGFLNTKRIVLWDNTIAKLNERELLFVMGHEMGHYVLKHPVKFVLFLSIFILLALYVAYRAGGKLIAAFQNRFGFDELSDIASLPLLILLINLFALPMVPPILAYSRHIEHEADRLGLEITQDNYAAATAFVKLQSENLGNPRPGWLYKLWRSSHPPLGERIDFCNRYRPWETDQPLKYQNLFR